MMSEHKMRCPSCDGIDIRKSLPRGVMDTIMLQFSRKPFRCRRCERRFYANPDRPQPEPAVDIDEQFEHR